MIIWCIDTDFLYNIGRNPLFHIVVELAAAAATASGGGRGATATERSTLATRWLYVHKIVMNCSGIQ